MTKTLRRRWIVRVYDRHAHLELVDYRQFHTRLAASAWALRINVSDDHKCAHVQKRDTPALSRSMR